MEAISEKSSNAPKEIKMFETAAAQQIISILSPKPLRKKATQSPLVSPLHRSLMAGARLSGTSDPSEASLDLTDLTIEIEKLSKVKEGPETALKDAKRLLSEIDEQMEISFEIIEERHGLVKDYLHGRERAERMHRNRTNKLLKRFDDEMKRMEAKIATTTTTTITATTIPKTWNSSGSQTDLIEVLERFSQTEFVGLVVENERQGDIANIAEDLLTQLKHAMQNQLAKEKAKLYRDKNEIDLYLINEILDELQDFRDMKHEPRKIEEGVVGKLAVDECNEGEDTSASVGQHPGTERTDATRSLPAGSSCPKPLLASGHVHMAEIATICSAVNALDNKIAQLVDRSGADDTSLADLTYSREEQMKNLKEILLKADLFPFQDLAARRRSLIIEASQRKLELVQRNKELDIILERSFEPQKCGNLYVELNPATNKELELVKSEQVLRIRPVFGDGLLKDLLENTGLNTTNLKATNAVIYEEKTLEIVLKGYEQEITSLSRELCIATVNHMMEDIFNRKKESYSALIAALQEEREKTLDQLSSIAPKAKEIKFAIEKAKHEKDQIQFEISILMHTQNQLRHDLTDVNRQVAEQLLSKEREQVKGSIEKRLGNICQEIERMQSKLGELLSKKYRQNDIEERSGSLVGKADNTDYSSLRRMLDRIEPHVKLSDELEEQIDSGYSEYLPTSREVDMIIETKRSLLRNVHDVESKLKDAEFNKLVQTLSQDSLENIDDIQYDMAPPVVGDAPQSSSQNKKDVDIEDIRIESALSNPGSNGPPSRQEQPQDLRKVLNDFPGKIEDDRAENMDIGELKTAVNSLQASLEQVTKELSVACQRRTLNGETAQTANNMKEEGNESQSQKLKRNSGSSNNPLKLKKKSEPCVTSTQAKSALKDLLREREQTKLTILGLDEALQTFEQAQSSDLGPQNEISVQKRASNIEKMVNTSMKRLDEFINRVKEMVSDNIMKLQNGSGKEQSYNLSIAYENLRSLTVNIANNERQLTSIDSFTKTNEIPKEAEQDLRDLFARKKNYEIALEVVDEQSLSESREIATSEKRASTKNNFSTKISEASEAIKLKGNRLRDELKSLKARRDDIIRSLTAEQLEEVELRQVLEEFSNYSSGSLGEKQSLNEAKALMERRADKLRSTRIDDPFRLDALYTIDENVKGLIQSADEYVSELSAEKMPRPDEVRRILEFKIGLDIIANSYKKKYDSLIESRTSARMRQANMAKVQELKSLNEKKLDNIVQKIRILNALLEKERRLSKESGDALLSPRSKRDLEVTLAEISYELESIISSYDKEVAKSEQSPMQVCTQEALDASALTDLLAARDEKLNNLFDIEQQLQRSDEMSDFIISELLLEKCSLEKEIDEIEIQILDGEFESSDETLQKMLSPARSFSPRRTSSRNGLLAALDERDHVLRTLFQNRIREEKLLSQDSTTAKSEDLEILKEESRVLKQKLQDIDFEILDLNAASATTEEQPVNREASDVDEEIEQLASDLRHGKIRITRPTQVETVETVPNQQMNIKDFERRKKMNPKTTTVNEDRIKELELEKERLTKDLQKHKRRIQLLESKEKERLTHSVVERPQAIDVAADACHSVSEKRQGREELLVTIKDLNLEKSSNLAHLESIERQLRKFRRAIRAKLRVLQEAATTDPQLSATDVRHSLDKDIEETKEALAALESHKNDLQESLHNASISHDISPSRLNDLLAKRKDILSRMNEAERKFEMQGISQEKAALAKRIAHLGSQDKALGQENMYLKEKIKALNSRIKEVRETQEKNSDDERMENIVDKYRRVVGESLSEVIEGEVITEVPDPLKEVKAIVTLKRSDLGKLLEEKNSQIASNQDQIKTLEALLREFQANRMPETTQPQMQSKMQGIQPNERDSRISTVENDIVLDELQLNDYQESVELLENESARLDGEDPTGKEVTTATLTNQIKELQGELDRCQGRLLINADRDRKFREALGNKLYDLIENPLSQAVALSLKQEKYLQEVQNAILSKSSSIEQVLEQNYTDLEDIIKRKNDVLQYAKAEPLGPARMAELNEVTKALELKIKSLEDLRDQDDKELIALRKAKHELGQLLYEKDSQIEVYKSNESSSRVEIEVLKDELDQTMKDSSTLHAEARRLKEELDSIKERSELLTEQNENLKENLKRKFKDEIQDRSRYENLKREFLDFKGNAQRDLEDLMKANELNRKLEVEIIENSSQLKKLELQLGLKKEEVESVKTQNQCLHDKLNTLQSDEREMRRLLNAKTDDAETIHRENRALREDLRKKEIVISDLKSSIDAQASKLKREVDEHENDVEKLKGVAREAKQRARELELLVDAVKSKESEVKKQTVEKLKTSYEGEIVTLQERHKDKMALLKKELRNSQEEASSLRSRMEQLSEDLEKNCAQKDEAAKENEQLKLKQRVREEEFERSMINLRTEMSERITIVQAAMQKQIDDLEAALKINGNVNEKQLQIEKDLRRRLENVENELSRKNKYIKEFERNQKSKLSSIDAEKEFLQLENLDLKDAIKDLEGQLKKQQEEGLRQAELLEQRKELDRIKEALDKQKAEIESDASGFQASSKLDTPRTTRISTARGERPSLSLMRSIQEERDRMSDEVIRTSRELAIARNEVKKLKFDLQQQAVDQKHDDSVLLHTLECDYKQKLDEIMRAHSAEREKLRRIFHDERSKWEDEMHVLKRNLQEDCLRKLGEQRLDLERAFQENISAFDKKSQELVEELYEKVANLEKEKGEILRQFEAEKIKNARKHETEKNALEEIVRRLLQNVLRQKDYRSRLNRSFKEELSELEGRFDTEKSQLEQKREEEIRLLREKLLEMQASRLAHDRENTDSSSTSLRGSQSMYLPVRLRPEKESDAVHTSLQNEVSFEDLTEFPDRIDAKYARNDENVRNETKQQYEDTLRVEADRLLRRLFELSDELDSLRSVL